MHNKFLSIIYIIYGFTKKHILSISIIGILSILFLFIYYTKIIIENSKSFILVTLLASIFIISINLIEKSMLIVDFDQTSKLTLKIFSKTIIAIIVSPFLIYLIVLYFKINSNLFVKIGSSSDWIGFSGSIIGGGLTLIAVVFAFILEKKNREIEIDKTQIPKLHMESSIIKGEDDNKQKSIFIYQDDSDYIQINIDLILKNISTHTAKNFVVTECNLYTYNALSFGLDKSTEPLEDYDLSNELSKKIKNTELLIGEYSADFSISSRIKKQYVVSDEEFPYRVLKTTIQYTSQFEQITYILNSHIEISVSKHSLSRKSDVIKKYSNSLYMLTVIKTVNNLKLKNSRANH